MKALRDYYSDWCAEKSADTGVRNPCERVTLSQAPDDWQIPQSDPDTTSQDNPMSKNPFIILVNVGGDYFSADDIFSFTTTKGIFLRNSQALKQHLDAPWISKILLSTDRVSAPISIATHKALLSSLSAFISIVFALMGALLTSYILASEESIRLRSSLVFLWINGVRDSGINLVSVARVTCVTASTFALLVFSIPTDRVINGFIALAMVGLLAATHLFMLSQASKKFFDRLTGG